VDSIRQQFRKVATRALLLGERLRARSRWRWAQLWPEINCTLESGSALTVPRSSKIARGLFEGFYESREREFFMSFLRPDDVFYDIGANVGLYSVLATAKLGAAGVIYSFEPNEAVLKFLRRNMQVHTGCEARIFGLALSDQPGELELSVPADGFDAWATLGQISTLDTCVTRRSVQVVTLDELQAREGLRRPSVVKLDVEGWESRVLRGATAVLGEPDAPMLMVELCDLASEGAGSSTAELLGLLDGLGFQMFELGNKPGTVVPLVRRDSYPYVNVFAAKPGSVAGKRLLEVAGP